MFSPFDHLLGVEIRLLQEGQYRCSYAVVHRKGNVLDILEHRLVEGPLVKILESLPRRYPVALSLSGRGIIHKSVVGIGTGQPDLLREAFPSVEKKDIYVQEFVEDNDAWISIVRRTAANDILGKLKSGGIRVYALSLGGLPITGIWGMLGKPTGEVWIDGHLFSVGDEGGFPGYLFNGEIKGEKKIRLGENQVSQQVVLPYALAFQLFLHDRIEGVKTENEGIDHGFQRFLENARLKKVASLFIFTLLGMLLVSFLVLSHYNSENASLAEKAGHITATTDQGDMLKKEIALQKSQLDRMGWNGGYSYAFLLDEIGSSRPRLLNLTQVQFGEDRKTVSGLVDANAIKITGETGNLASVNNWMFMLRGKKWVRNVKLLRYQQDMESENYLFSLLIQY